MIYFTSDTHFWHKGIIDYCKRPFSSVEAMNETLIENWNSRVQPSDTIYFLGDFSFGNREHTEEVLRRLNGHKHLIVGNHDRHGRHTKKKNDPFPWDFWFNSVADYRRINVEGMKFVLCHFPFASWERGYVNLHGHTHGMHKGYFAQHDVGVDSNNFTPISAQEAYDRARYLGKRPAPY